MDQVTLSVVFQGTQASMDSLIPAKKKFLGSTLISLTSFSSNVLF